MAKPMRVCFVSRKWPPAMGGMETYSRDLSDALEAHAEVERIVLPGHPDGSVPTLAELLRFGVSTALRLLFARNPAPVVHVADMASWPLALFARLRRPGGRRVLSAHGTDVAFPDRGGVKGRLYGAYLRLGALLLGRVAVIANSGVTAQRAIRLGYRDTSVVPLAAEGMVPAHRTPRRAVLFSGRLIPMKGCSWFVREVLPLLPEDITLEVAGTVWDSAEAAALDNPRVRHLGRLDQDALWQAYADALCVVVPNIVMANGASEGFGLVAVEAAAAGGVVLASRHGGIVDAVLDGRTGFLLPPGAAAEWAARIREIADWSPAERAAFTDAARQACATHFTWRRVARETFALYQTDTREPTPVAGTP